MSEVFPSSQDVLDLFRRHHGDPASNGWRVRMRVRFGYRQSPEWYQALVDRLVKPTTRWIDVGGGKALFPHDPRLSRELADRCRLLVGVDPSGNLSMNPFVDEYANCLIEDYQPATVFDLATFRMVAEHVTEPDKVLSALTRLIAAGGHVVIYTPSRWTPISILASIIPNRFHALFVDRDSEDVFPTCYKMNTRSTLRKLFESHGFREVGFMQVDDCVLMNRFPLTHFVELTIWRALNLVGLRYPQTDLLGLYERL